MKRYELGTAARSAVSASPDRPAVSILHDADEGRLVVFRLAPGQRVADHMSPSNVFLTVVSGTGFVHGAEGEQPVRQGDMIAFGPREPHGMRADQDELVLAAILTPRPGSR